MWNVLAFHLIKFSERSAFVEYSDTLTVSNPAHLFIIHSFLICQIHPSIQTFSPPFIFCYSYLIYCVIISFTFCLFFIHLSFCVLFCFLKRDFSKYHFSSWSLLACWFSVLEKLSRRPSSNFYFSIYIIYNLFVFTFFFCFVPTHTP